MSTTPSTSTSQSNFVSIFNASLDSYKRKTKKDLVSHPLLPSFQYCESPEAVLAVLREQVPAFNQSQSRDDGLTKWVTPTVNVLYSFSKTIGQGVGLAFPPASVIFTGIGALLSAAKDASASHDKLIDIFSRIEHFFRRLEIYISITPTRAMSDIIVEIMVEVLTILAVVTIEVERGRFKRYLKKLTGKREIEDSLEKLDKLTQEEARMASAEQLKMTHSVDDRVRGVGDQVQYNRGVHDKLDQVKRNQLRDSLLRWLSPPDPSTNHNIASKAHHNGTSEWLFQGSIFNQWKSTGSFLWIRGKPGSGKSVVCSSIIQDVMTLRDAGKASMAYFYFDFRDVDKQKLRNVLPSLLVQLSAFSDACCDKLSQLYSAHDRGAQKPSDSAMVECLKQMLALEGQGPTYIILDALDECPVTFMHSPRDEVLELVEELVGLHLPNLHICVTSRPEWDIQFVLERLTSHPVSLHDESGQMEDIVNYISSFIHSNQRMRRWREGDRELVIKTLSEKADGMFRWVFCQLELLRHCFPHSVRRVLEELPDSLDETYERILREIRKPMQDHAHRLLQCLAVAVRPLRVEELGEVLAMDFNTGGIAKLNPSWRWEDQEEAVMSACSSLVTIIKERNPPVVQFSHFSVKEFLTADRLAEPMRDVSRYHIRLEAAHAILARACLGVLLRLDDRVDLDDIECFPFARYAAQYWPAHARVENVSSLIREGMECLFDGDKPHFATWLWIYDEDWYGRSMSTMRPEEPEAVPLYYAAQLGFRELVEHLITKYPEHVSARGGLQVTPIHAAASAGQTHILSLLVEHGADVNGRDRAGCTPLFLASTNARLEAGQFLLNHGADIDARDKFNNSALIYAIGRDNNIEFVRMLLERGAVISARCWGDMTPLHCAALNGRTEVVRLLLEHGADVNALDEDGNTPSQLGPHYGHPESAALNGRTEIVQLLLEHGADVNALDEDGNSSSQLGPHYGHSESVELLSEHGAESVKKASLLSTILMYLQYLGDLVYDIAGGGPCCARA